MRRTLSNNARLMSYRKALITFESGQKKAKKHILCKSFFRLCVRTEKSKNLFVIFELICYDFEENNFDLAGNDRGNNFGWGRGIAPAPAGAKAGVYTMLYIVSRIHS